MSYWLGQNHHAYVIEHDGKVLGSYFICANQKGGGDHVCNCGFVTSPSARGMGLARKMLEHALGIARQMEFKAMQFNFVIATNAAAIKIWHDNDFKTVGRLPKAFNHPSKGYVDALVMYRML